MNILPPTAVHDSVTAQSYGMPGSGSTTSALSSPSSSTPSISPAMALDRLKIAEKAVYSLTGQTLDAIVLEYVSRLPAATGLPAPAGGGDGFEDLLTYISAYPDPAVTGATPGAAPGPGASSGVSGTTADVFGALLMPSGGAGATAMAVSSHAPSPVPPSVVEPAVTIGSADPLAGSPYSPLDMLLSGSSPAGSPMPSSPALPTSGPTSPTYLGVPPSTLPTTGSSSPRSQGSTRGTASTDSSAVTHQALVNHLHSHIESLQQWRRDNPGESAVMTMSRITDLVRSITGDSFYDFQLMCVAQHKRALVAPGSPGTVPGSSEPCVNLDELIRVCARDWKVSQRKIRKRSTRGGSPTPGAVEGGEETALVETPSDDPARLRAVVELRALDGLYGKLKKAPSEEVVKVSWSHGAGDGTWVDLPSGGSIPSGHWVRLTLDPGSEPAGSSVLASVLYRAEHGLFFLPLVLNKAKNGRPQAYVSLSAASGPISIGGDSSGALSAPGTRIQETLPDGKSSTVVSYTVVLRRAASLTRLSAKFKIVAAS